MFVIHRAFFDFGVNFLIFAHCERAGVVEVRECGLRLVFDVVGRSQIPLMDKKIWATFEPD